MYAIILAIADNTTTPNKGNSMKSLKTKLFIPIFILALMGIALALSFVFSLKSVQRADEHVSAKIIPTMRIADETRADVLKLHNLILSYCVASSSEEIDIQYEMTDYQKQVTEDLDAYMQMLDESEKASNTAISEIYNQYLKEYNLIMGLKFTNGDQAALEKVNTSLTDIYTQLEAQVQRIIEDSQKELTLSNESRLQLYETASVFSLIMFIAFVIIVLFSVFSISSSVISPTLKVEKKLRSIIDGITRKEGDLTERVPARTKDEIGRLAQGINAFLQTLQNIMANIIHSSDSLTDVVTNVTLSVASSNQDSQDISVTMEQLAATMQRISSTTEQTARNAHRAEESIHNVASSADTIYNYTIEMKNRAEHLEQVAITSKATTTSMTEAMMQSLKKAIADSEGIRRINELTNEILSIATQTNLLALNASIEAARAGDAGRGFAVVADQIRLLADSSKETANEIQHINAVITSVVQELSRHSNDMLEYVDHTILPDYENFVLSGKQYREDAVFVNDTMTECTSMTDTLASIINDLASAMQQVSAAVEESSDGIAGSAASTSNLAKQFIHITNEMKQISAIVTQLKEQSDSFCKY